MFPWKYVDGLWTTMSEGVGLIVGSVKRFFRKTALRPFRSSKVIDFGTNREHVYDFRLVRRSNLGPT